MNVQPLGDRVLVMRLEEEFLGGDQIPEDDQNQLTTVGEVIKYIQSKKG